MAWTNAEGVEFFDLTDKADQRRFDASLDALEADAQRFVTEDEQIRALDDAAQEFLRNIDGYDWAVGEAGDE